ncbi:hypothetical protein [Microvirga flavescens]|uniref:hypothetical protein n=1 Tax=Microvirga flavescens TaxID=2249811 RepID=UPI000DD6CBCD|nr:hypothetical protein [Microvirga flavescens]
MILNRLFKARRNEAANSASVEDRDEGSALVILLMMALVFAPIIGLHIAYTAFNSPTADSVRLAHSKIDAAQR